MTDTAPQPLDLEPIKARYEAATPPPWAHRPPPSVDGTIHKVFGSETSTPLLSMSDTGYSASTSWERRKADAEFIAAARSDVPALVAEVERLRRELDEAQLRSIEARNPGIDIEEVRRIRQAPLGDRRGFRIDL